MEGQRSYSAYISRVLAIIIALVLLGFAIWAVVNFASEDDGPSLGTGHSGDNSSEDEARVSLGGEDEDEQPAEPQENDEEEHNHEGDDEHEHEDEGEDGEHEHDDEDDHNHDEDEDNTDDQVAQVEQTDEGAVVVPTDEEDEGFTSSTNTDNDPVLNAQTEAELDALLAAEEDDDLPNTGAELVYIPLIGLAAYVASKKYLQIRDQ